MRSAACPQRSLFPYHIHMHTKPLTIATIQLGKKSSESDCLSTVTEILAKTKRRLQDLNLRGQSPTDDV